MVDALTAGIIGTAVLGGAVNTTQGFAQGSALKERGRALQEFYNDQARTNKIVSDRQAAKAQGAAITEAGSSGVAFSGSKLAAAFDSIFEFEFGEASRRANLRAQGIFAKGGQDFSASSAFGSAITGPLSAANTIFAGLSQGSVKKTPDERNVEGEIK